MTIAQKMNLSLWLIIITFIVTQAFDYYWKRQ